jgi:hypothetical protein
MGVDVVNIDDNPSLEHNDNNWGGIGVGTTTGTDDTHQRRGALSLAVVPDVGVNDGAYKDIVTLAAGQHTCGIDCYLENGLSYQFYVDDGGGIPMSEVKIVTGTGHWQRVNVSFVETAPGARIVYFLKNGSANVTPFWLDGLLIALSDYELTYFDGDSVGLLETRKDFYWNGFPHASTSTMRAQTRGCGRLVHLSELGIDLTAIVGLGMTPFQNQSVPLTTGGEVYSESVAQGEVFDLILRAGGKTTQELMDARRNLRAVINPKGAPIDQPFVVQITPCNSCGIAIGDTVQITCQYQSGLQGNLDNDYAEEIDLRLQVFLPYIERAGTGGGEALDPNLTSNVFGYIEGFNVNTGAWNDLATGVDAVVSALDISPYGLLYAGGAIMNAGGGAASRIAEYNPMTDAWAALGAGVDDWVYAVAHDSLGQIYVGGLFLNAGGGGANRIAMWNGAWNTLGVGVDDTVNAIVIDSQGRVYVGGAFLNAGGAGANRIAMWDPATAAWSTLGTGLNNNVSCMAIDQFDNVYASGPFTTAGGGAAVRIAKWDPVAATWSALGSGLDVAATDLLFSPNGTLYAGGLFATAGGVTVNKVAAWNGYYWSPLGTGLLGGDVGSMGIDAKGNLWVSGTFTSAGTIATPGNSAIWNGSSWTYTPYIGGAFGVDAQVAHNDVFYLAAQFPGVTTLINSVETVTSIADNSPIFRINHLGGTDPTRVYQISNFTTGDNIFFNLQLMPGEVLEVDTSRATVKTNIRPLLLNSVLPGSNLATFRLAPGSNIIGIFCVADAGPEAEVFIYWSDHLQSLDDVVW